MAKSIRSKRRRKMRNIKREAFGKKELEMLKDVVEKAKAEKDVEMKEMFTVKSATELKEDQKMDTSKASRNYNPKTLKNEHGNYPVWMSQRKMKKVKKTQKKQAKAKAKAKKK
ncbi:protein LLP-like [Ruditapes philippinarum]|uniref:protein LLP-like n=1 Tax=Ruditapes philippinarum TaxID=129788 RepID=UPI00295BC791|nr:protein LLP-like [Ruditapes philippinarum]